MSRRMITTRVPVRVGADEKSVAPAATSPEARFKRLRPAIDPPYPATTATVAVIEATEQHAALKRELAAQQEQIAALAKQLEEMNNFLEGVIKERDAALCAVDLADKRVLTLMDDYADVRRRLELMSSEHVSDFEPPVAIMLLHTDGEEQLRSQPASLADELMSVPENEAANGTLLEGVLAN